VANNVFNFTTITIPKGVTITLTANVDNTPVYWLAAGDALLAQELMHAADGLQLAAALIWCQGRPQRRVFVCFDQQLARAATEVGFEVRS
jgi:hypothetical protein